MMRQDELVSIICLSFNQKSYVVEALQSILDQTYKNIEIIIVDDGSTDGTVQVIEEFISKHTTIRFIRLDENKGNCKAFNEGLKIVNGDYLIDLAADDILLPTRVEVGVKSFTEAGEKYGVHFSDAEIINEDGRFIRLHSHQHLHKLVPQGDVYVDLIHRYFICPPSLMFRKAVIDQLGGYDESLAYEDFDFLIRSSRDFHFIYSPFVLVKKRLVKNSMSSKQFIRSSAQRWSTLKVCEKIEKLNRSEMEVAALKKRLRYEILLSLRLFDLKLFIAFLKFYFRLSWPRTMLT